MFAKGVFGGCLCACLMAAFPVEATTANALALTEKTGVFADYFYNKTDRETESAQSGFHSSTHGMIGGFNARLSERTFFGAAYTYSKTDVKTARDDTVNIDMHTALLYGIWRPSDVFWTGTASFGWAKNDRTVAATGVSERFDSRVAVVQTFGGYEFENSAPMYGVRYVHADDKSNLRKKTDIVTGIIKMRAAKTYRQGKTVTICPDISLAGTYDFVADNDTIMVLLPNGAGYTVNSKRLDRLGAEVSLGVTLGVGDAFRLSLNYIGAGKSDYQSHTLAVHAEYAF